MDRVKEMFNCAYSLYNKSISQLDKGNVRDATEKAWRAALRATNALILAKTGEEPGKTPITSKKIEELRLKDGKLEELKIADRYHSRADYLHGRWFFLGLREPKEPIEKD